jgi:hypothetical protein
MRKLIAVAMGIVVALVGFAGTANASATVDLIWADTGTNVISDLAVSDSVQLNVILTAGPNGAVGASVSVDYSGVLGNLVVVGYANTPSGALPVDFETPPTDTGDRIEGIVSTAQPFANLGMGLLAGQSHQLGTVTFHNIALIHGVLGIQSDANGPLDGVGDLLYNDITATTTFNSAYLVGTGDPSRCSDSQGNFMQIEVNTLRAGGKTVVTGPNDTTDVTAKARIQKGTAVSDTTLDTQLTIEAVTPPGGTVIGTNSTGPIRLGVGKGGKGAKLSLATEQCVGGYIEFVATFFGTDNDGDPCEETRTLRKECK